MGRLTNELFREIAHLSSQGLLVVDIAKPAITIVYANRAYETLSGYAADELEGSSWLGYAAMDEAAPDTLKLRQMLANGESGALRFPFFRKDGEIWFAEMNLVPLESPTASGWLALVEHAVGPGPASAEVESLRRALGHAEQTIASIDQTDPITGLLSASQFRLMLRRDIAVARRGDRSLHLMLFSIPELDVYRKTFGGRAADSCIRMIGAQIAGTFRRASDLSARVDESTLGVAVSGQDDDEVRQLVAKVEKKSRSLGLHNPRGRIDRYVVVQGVAVVSETRTDDADTLMARGQEALERRVDRRSRSRSA